MLASWVVTAVAAGVTKWPSEQLAPSLAALAIMLSYWFSGPAIASEFGLAAAFGIAIQGLSHPRCRLAVEEVLG